MGNLKLELVVNERFKRNKWALIRISFGDTKSPYSIHRTCDLPYCKLSFGQGFDTSNKFNTWFTDGDELSRVRNLDLRRVLNELEETYVKLCGKSILPPSALEIRETWKNRKPEKPPTKLLDFFKVCAEDKKVEASTARSYEATRQSVEDFLRIKYGVEDNSYLLETVDSPFIYRYEHFIASAKTPKGKRYSNGTAAQYLVKLKAVLSHAFHSGEIKVNVAKDHKWTGILKDDADKVVSADVVTDAVFWKIPKESLHKIEAMQLEGKAIEELGRVRLLFILQSYTGLAYGDLCALKDARIKIRLDLNGTKSLIYNRAKNGELAMVPILAQTEKLLEALEFDFTPQTSYDTYKRKVRALMRYYEVPVAAEDIGTHTGRHLFGTRMIHMGFSMHMVSRMMGHTSIKETERTYARVDITAINADWDRIKILQQPTGEKLAI